MVQKSRMKSNPPISRVLKVQGLGSMEIAALVKDAALAWNTDGAASMGAAFAFYTIFSITPAPANRCFQR
jgi:hypothetical protein